MRGRPCRAYGITKRFVGEEPTDPETARYNEILKKTLPPAVEVEVYPRLEKDGAPITATAVRRAFLENDWETVQKLVPEGTFAMLSKNRAEVRKCWGS